MSQQIQAISWPVDLIEDLALRRCIIFLGSGVSATAQNSSQERPKAWKEFLLTASELIANKKDKVHTKRLIKEGNYLLALQCIYDSIGNNQYFTLLQSEFLTPRFEPSDVHKDIVDIDPKIAITTNFDKIYDKACFSDAHTIITYDQHEGLINNLRSDQRLVIKAHGTIDAIQNMIFTKREYFAAKKNHPHFYKVLAALFMTNTILFLGCGLNDPDIALLLEHVYITTNSYKSHYAIVFDAVHPSVEKDWMESYNVKALKYGPSYEDLIPNIRNLKDAVVAYRQRRGLP
ncbi:MULTISPECIES: SIR2 family NAD-dependent protein deacylase [Pelosinus]|uniref:Sir2-like protein n=1 Tax=Pelosinus fermentans B4 TaxID=1149862 RepID=I9LGF8_9FIRM|nr:MULTISPECIES: SIR2 family protein [Pelosinus]EIW19589.1 Sir2-like protein [Pelosinus fermentans B4]EIW24678.1 Sir2-like protein [Pelosinus fermentans A11]OAM96042.1 Sir2-like protein [Pelosinus fermentans DSM 17108]SDR35694.1 SIR2-like domain-containing protein [Pelosinus fermentans]